MSLFDSIKGRFEIIAFGEFDAPDVRKIWTSLRNIYDNSSILRLTITQWIDNHQNSNIIIQNTAGDTNAPFNSGYIYLNLDDVTGLKYINTHGKTVIHTLDSILAHEFGHAVGPFDDNWDWSNLKGPNILNFANPVFSQLGFDREASYLSRSRSNNLLLGKDYTDGNLVVNALVDNGVDYSEDKQYPPNDPILPQNPDFYAHGTPGPILFVGSVRDNSVTGSDENDYLYGQGGEDRLRGYGGTDHLYGGDEADNIWGGSGNDVISGGEGDDKIEGGDSFYPLASDEDTIAGGEGNDTIDGGADDDVISGGAGDDKILGGRGKDQLNGGSENDILVGGYDVDTVRGGAGNDIIDAAQQDGPSGNPVDSTSPDELWGGSGADVFLTNHGDTINDIDRGDLVKLEGKWLVGGERKAPPRNPCDPEPGTGPDDGTYTAADGTKYKLSGSTLTVNSGFFGSTITIKDFRNGEGGIHLKNARPNTKQAECNRDPLIIDLDGDRNVVRELFDSTAYFDLDNDGFRERVAWSLANDGFLVRDLNGNGQIDDGTEMFGSGRTEFEAGDIRQRGASGFAELAELDSNLDGAISALDINFAALKVWVDANGDAVTDDGELKSLDELGIVSISLNKLASDDLDCGCDGTEVTYRSEVSFGDGSIKSMYDAYLSIDQYDTREIDPDVVIPDDFADLPFLIGSGTLSDLHVAMARDPALEEMIREFAAFDVSQATQVIERVEQIILRWTGADQVAEDSRGPTINAQWLQALEMVSGSAFNQASIGPNPRGDAASILIMEWQGFIQRTTGELLGQTALGLELMPQMRFASAAFFVVETGTNLSTVVTNLSALAPASPADQVKYWQAGIFATLQYASALELTEDLILAAFDANATFANLALSASELAKVQLADDSGDRLIGRELVPGTFADDLDRSGRDVLMANANGVTLDGQSGNDTYVVHQGTEGVRILASSGTDRLVLLDMNRADVTLQAIVSTAPQDITDISDIRIELTLRHGPSGWSTAFEVPVFTAGIDQTVTVIDFADQQGIRVSELVKDIDIASPFGRVNFVSGAQLPSEGSAGDDIFIGSEGSDSFTYTPGQGDDLFINLCSQASNDDVMTIAAPRSEVTFRVDENSANLVIETATGRALVVGQFADGQGIERFVFSDGTQLDSAILHRELMTGTTGSDVIDGTIQGELIDGKGGGDLLRGGYGDDVYHFETGYGAVRISDPLGQNAIELTGIASSNVVVLRGTTESVLSFGNGADTISLSGEAIGYQLRFSDRTVSLGQLLLEQGQVGATTNANRIMGTRYSDYSLEGTSGNDVIYGMGNDDFLTGGTGDDTYVYTGASRILFFEDGGFDIVRPSAQFTWERVILLDDGIAFEGEDFGFINHDNSYVNATGLPSNGGMAIEALQFSDGRTADFTSGWKNDGTSGSDILFNFSTAASTFRPGAGGDRIFSYGPTSNKTVVLTEGFGHDVWYHRSNFTLDMTAFALDARVAFTREGNDLVIRVDGDANSFTLVDAFHPYTTPTSTTIRNAASVVQFAGGVSLSMTALAARIAVATSDSDVLFGRASLDGGAGDDTLIGDNAANTYRFGRGFGNDVVKEENQGVAQYSAVDALILEGLNRSDVTFERHPDDAKSILITIKDTGETLTLDGTPWDDYRYIDRDLDQWENTNDRFGAHWIEEIRFADGSTISQRAIEQELLDAERTVGDDTIINFGAPDKVTNTNGSYLDGGAGDDTYINDYARIFLRFGAGSGDDVVKTQFGIFGDFVVQLVGLSAADVYVEFEVRDRVGYTVLKARDGSSLAFDQTLREIGSITVVDEAGVSRRVFQDGGLVPNLTGSNSDDYLVSSIGASVAGVTTRPNAVVDTFDGGAGNDIIAGYGGEDVVRFGRGDGTDILLESRPLGSATNQLQRYVVQFDSGVNREDVSIGWALDGSGRLVLSIAGTSDKLLLNPENFQAIVFADGRRVQTTNTGNGAEIVNLSSFLPVGTPGNDVRLLRGGQTIRSGAGDDTIYFIGSTSERGTIEFGPGDGHDVFINRTSVDLNGDIYSIAHNLTHRLNLRAINSYDELRITRASDDQDDVIIEIKATGETLRLVDQIFERTPGYTTPAIREIYLLDSNIAHNIRWDEMIRRMVIDEEVPVDAVLTTKIGGGILDGGSGFDALNGGSGDDAYIFGRAYDEDVIRDAGGRDTLYFDQGISRDDVVFSRAGENDADLLVEVLGLDRLSLTIENQFKLRTGQIEFFRFSDGNVLAADDIPAIVLGDLATSTDDTIVGFATEDTINSRGGNDSIQGMGGDDEIDGGAGRDRAVYRGTASEYEVTTANGTTTLRDLVAGRDGTDTLNGVEDIEFIGGGTTQALVAPNRAPTAQTTNLTAIEDTVVIVARSALMALASDADNDSLTLTVGDAVHGRVWIGSDGNIHFRPDSDFNGSASFRYTVNDGNGGSASALIGVEVSSENDAPRLNFELEDVTFPEDNQVLIAIPTEAFTDVEGQAVTLSARLANDEPLPSWLTLSAGTISGTPLENFSASLDIKVSASDGSATSFDIFRLTFLPINDAPEIVTELGDIEASPGSTISFAISQNNYRDVDSPTLKIQVSLTNGDPLPSWLTFSADVLQGTVPVDFTGSLELVATISDGQAITTDYFDLNVADNTAPVLAQPLADVSSPEDTLLALAIPSGTFTDADEDPLTYSATLADGDPLPSWLALADGLFTGTPPANFNGALDIAVTASDGTVSVSDTFTLTITPVNDAPVLAQPLADVTSPEDAPVTVTIPTNAFTDADGQTLAFTAKLSNGDPLPSWLTLANSVLTGTPPANFDGTLDIAVTASDETASASDTFTLTITPVNDAPVLALPLPDASSTEDALLSLAIPSGTFTDADNNTLTYSATLANGDPLPSWLVLADGIFTGTPSANFSGALNITVSASDGTASVSDTFTLTVTPVNDAPVLAQPLADVSSPEDALVSITIPAGAFTDVDAQALTYTAKLANGDPLPSWLALSGGAISGTPPTDFNGALDITVTASDETASASDTFTLTITPVNDAPISEDDTGFATPVGTALTLEPAVLTANDSDADLDVLTIFSVANGTGGTVALDAQGKVVFTPTLSQAGSATFQYTASDGLLTSTATVTVQVQSLTPNVVNGGNGNDTIVGVANAPNQIDGSNGDDTITGGNLSDHLLGGNGIDTISGGGGNDTIDGGNGNDILDGGTGNDILTGDHGDDRITGGAGNDTIVGDKGSDTLVLAGLQSTYGVKTISGELNVRDLAPTSNGDDGQDIVSLIEFIQFGDGSVVAFNAFVAQAPTFG